MPPWCSEVESKMASSILDKKLSSCPECNETRGASYNYYDIRCADKFEENSCIYGKTIVSVILQSYFFFLRLVFAGVVIRSAL